MFKFESDQALKRIKEATHKLVEDSEKLNEIMKQTQN